MKLTLLIAGWILTLGLCFFSGLLLGEFRGQNAGQNQRYQDERDAVAPVLAADPAFVGVKIMARSTGGIYLIGEVPTPADLERLRVQVAKVLGEFRARDMYYAVVVKGKSKG